MLEPSKIPLAWKNLTHDLRRLLLAVAGIGFAVLLMCMQLSFRRALFDSTVALVHHLNADLVIVSQAKYTILVRETFSRRRLYQALACEGVKTAWPLYIETQRSVLKNLETGEVQPIRVLAYDPAEPVLNLPAARAHADQLRLPGTALFDTRSKTGYGPIEPGDELELAGSRIRILGLFSLGTDFATDGNLITSALNYSDLFSAPSRDDDILSNVDIGLVTVAPRQSLDKVRQRLDRLLPDDVAVLTRAEFEFQERQFWETSTPIGYVFWLGTLMGFVVGVVICYQILYADIADHLAEFATLKAMGYHNRYFIGVVLQESVLLSLLGFLPGVAASGLICQMVAGATGLVIGLRPGIVFLVLALSMAMCVLSGTLTMRKVLTADPAELF